MESNKGGGYAGAHRTPFPHSLQVDKVTFYLRCTLQTTNCFLMALSTAQMIVMTNRVTNSSFDLTACETKVATKF